MTEAAPRASRRLQAHRPPRGMGPAFLLSILAHVVLILAIAFAVRWNTQPVGPVAVELWSGSPPVAVTPPRPAPAPPPPKVEPAPERPADIVLEPKKDPPKVEPKKVEPKKEEPKKEEPKKPPPPDPKIEAKRIADAKAAEAKKVAEAKAAEAKRAAERHEAELKRITAAAGPVKGAASSGGVPSGYDAQVVACIRPHIVFAVPDGVRSGQYVAEFEVSLAPTGEQLGAPKLLKPSGLPAYDQAVERAIRRCDPFPRPKEGTMPRVLRPVFDPVESR